MHPFSQKLPCRLEPGFVGLLRLPGAIPLSGVWFLLGHKIPEKPFVGAKSLLAGISSPTYGGVSPTYGPDLLPLVLKAHWQHLPVPPNGTRALPLVFFLLNHPRTGRFQGKESKARKQAMRECTVGT
jgi:hypothetical protein